MLKKICLGVALSWTVLIMYLCLIQSSDLPQIKIPNIDKCVHAFFYLVFSMLWFYVLRFYFKNQSNAALFKIVFFMSLLFGIGIELFQAFFTTSRNGDVADVLANVSGSLLAIILIHFLDKNIFSSKISK